ncbi:hypothetical protein M2372_002046 [Chryseobacterium sp. BIGb0232]|nr:hypothetical protein [Chryseobacterium sp. BIGb0232]ROS17256.1 hypothetical protein EDF65_1620 [Chryseobacterium nakagawai]
MNYVMFFGIIELFLLNINNYEQFFYLKITHTHQQKYYERKSNLI